MSILRGYLTVAGLPDVGYQLYARNTPLAARCTTDIIDEGDGAYSAGGVDLTLAGLDNVRWDSAGTPALRVREDITLRLLGVGLAAELDALKAEIDTIKAKTDLIFAGNVTVLSPVAITGGAILVRAGDSWSIPISGLGNLADAAKLWFSVNKQGAVDSLAKLFIERTSGLLVVNGAPATDASKGSLTINDPTLGNITIDVDEAVTEMEGGSATWTIKKETTGGTAKTLASGSFAIVKFGVSAIS